MPTHYPVTEMTLSDALEDLRLILDGSAEDVDGITAAADSHPAFDPAAAADGEGGMLLTFTDASGRRRVAEAELTLRWREESCWHLDTTTGALGQECTDCGTVTEPTQPNARCPECNVPVTDLASLFGVHAASCGVVMCQCEHADHERGAAGHPYLGVRAGTRRAQHVGLVCDDCAAGHLAEYLLDQSGDRR